MQITWILYIENPTDTTKKKTKQKNKPVETNKFGKAEGYNINILHKYLLYFCILVTNYQKKKLRKNPTYNCIKKNKIPRNKLNQ